MPTAVEIPGITDLVAGSKTIPVNSFSWGVSNSMSLTGGGGGKASFSEFSISVQDFAFAPLLLQACATGKHFPKVTITESRSSSGAHENAFEEFVLSSVFIASLQEGGSSGTPSLEISFLYGKIEWKTRSSDVTFDILHNG